MYKDLIPENLYGKSNYTKSDISVLYQNYQTLRYYEPAINAHFDRLYEWLNTQPDIFWNRLVVLAQSLEVDLKEDPIHAFILIFDPETELSQEDNDYLEDSCIVCGFTERCRYTDKTGGLCIEFVPNQTAEVTDKVYTSYKGQLIQPCYVYHLCRKDVYDNKIKKTGLIPKAKCKRGRHYAPRVYVFLQKPTESNIQNTIRQFVNGSTDITDHNKDLYNEWCLLQIDLSNGPKYRFFDDAEYSKFAPGIAAFTYETINPTSIKLLKTYSI